MNAFTKIIAERLSLHERSVDNTLALLDEGCTVPFISRYRKERTGNLDEVKVAEIDNLRAKFTELCKRKETVLKTIEEAGKMSDELRQRIDNCWDATLLEDIYLPFKPKRRTKAQVARQQGLEPLATIIMLQRETRPMDVAQRYVRGDVASAQDAIRGAQHIMAETMSENERTRQQLRKAFQREAVVTSKVVKAKADSDEAAKYSDYFDFAEPLRRCSSHRLMAMRRGESEGVLRVSIGVDDDACMANMRRQYVRPGTPCATIVAEAADDAYKRLLRPAMENEFAAASLQRAEDEAIGVFADNLRQLLLAAPLGQRRVMGIDPGFRTGCKVVCLDRQGNLLHHEAIFPHPPKADRTRAEKQVRRMADTYAVEAIAIGNGTASRETSEFIRSLHLGEQIRVFVVSEDGASVYSASATAREEFPNEDVTVRGAVSIARRLMDPLAELVKIEPKSIGVGQYQHDVDQSQLKKRLDETVVSCVNAVGVDLNTASKHLLTYISGLGPTLAGNIVEYRRQNGPFSSRAQLLKVPRLGRVAYQQCAGFIRIPGAQNPLDNSAVHPESYGIVERMARQSGCTVAELMKDKQRQKSIDLQQYVDGNVGMPTLRDIMRELDKPGRDPRSEIEEFEFDPRVKCTDDLAIGMTLPGIVTNITNFGAFVDIGVHQDGLVHVSQIADTYIAHPADALKLHQHVTVRVTDVDRKRGRISLSMRQVGRDNKKQ